MVKKIITQPLLHFILIGVFIFTVYEYSVSDNKTPADDKSIIVNRQSLLTYMQYRARAFRENSYSNELDAMPDAEMNIMINDLVREEVLFREAKMLGLDRDDYVIKQRLIQKMEYLTRALMRMETTPTDHDVKAYYSKNKHLYYQSPKVSFTHIYFDFKNSNKKTLQVIAINVRDELNNKQGMPGKFDQVGDPFLYHINYVEQTPEFITSHFGSTMADEIFAMRVDDQEWQGPLESEYGLHLVLLRDKKAAYIPGLTSIYQRVSKDVENENINAMTEAAIVELINSYDIKIATDDLTGISEGS